MKNIIIISLMLALSLNSFGQEQDTSYWTNSGLGALNFSQVSLTNWAGGGQNSISATALLNLRANYAKGNNSWDNVLDLALGGIKQGDNASFIKTDDNIDFTSKYGYKLNKNFHFTVLDNFRTQFTEGFNITDTDTTRISNLFAPAYNLFAMGIDYKPSDNFSVFISPITAKTTIVNDDIGFSIIADKVDVIEGGESTQTAITFYVVRSESLNQSMDIDYKLIPFGKNTVNSLDFVDLVVAIESNFGVKLVGEDFVSVETLQDFYDLIEKKIS